MTVLALLTAAAPVAGLAVLAVMAAIPFLLDEPGGLRLPRARPARPAAPAGRTAPALTGPAGAGVGPRAAQSY